MIENLDTELNQNTDEKLLFNPSPEKREPMTVNSYFGIKKK